MDNTTSDKAGEFLRKNRLATLATISKENIPQASFVYYLTDSDSNIYLVTNQESRKLTNILENNNVALVIGQEMDPLVLQIEGKAEIVEDANKKSELAKSYLDIANMNATTPNWPPIMKIITSQNYVFIKIKTDSFKFSDFSNMPGSIIEGTQADLH